MTTTPTPEALAGPDTVPPVWRSRAYVLALLAEVLVLLVTGVLAALGVITADRAVDLVAAVTAPMGLLAAGLGAAYRPTR